MTTAVPQLNVSTYIDQLFWLIPCALALFFFFLLVFIPRMNRIIDTRSAHISGIDKEIANLERELKDMRDDHNAEVLLLIHRINIMRSDACNDVAQYRSEFRKSIAEIECAEMRKIISHSQYIDDNRDALIDVAYYMLNVYNKMTNDGVESMSFVDFSSHFYDDVFVDELKSE